jgi:hypothetical protein
VPAAQCRQVTKDQEAREGILMIVDFWGIYANGSKSATIPVQKPALMLYGISD